MEKLIVCFKAFLLAFSGLIVAFGIAWWLMAQVNFSYGFWHDFGGMKAGIEKYAKTNVLKFGFENTTKAQRADLFAQIMDSVHNDGKGLENISFVVDGQPEQTLLIENEIVHLHDVANLVQFGFYLAVVAFVAWIGAWTFYGVKMVSPPSLGLQIGTIFIFIALSTALVFLIGPMNVFYQLHVWIFPDGHQWYFYFKESLMATLMYAPNFFGWVAVEWLLIAIVVFLGLQTTVAFLVNKIAAR